MNFHFFEVRLCGNAWLLCIPQWLDTCPPLSLLWGWGCHPSCGMSGKRLKGIHGSDWAIL